MSNIHNLADVKAKYGEKVVETATSFVVNAYGKYQPNISFVLAKDRVEVARERMPGTLAVTLAGVAQGAQIHRVHDVAEVVQGLRLWEAIRKGAA